MLLLTALVREPEVRLHAVELLAEDERRAVVGEFNSARVDFETPLIPHAFARQAASTPAAVALVEGPDSWTYRELAARVADLAEALRGRGVGAEDRVAIVLPRSADLVAAVLAVLMTGAAYVPVDPDYPQDRIDLLLSDAAPTFTIDPDFVAGVVSGGRDLDVPAIEPEQAAYVLFTSGSTGRPKGVVVPHAALALRIAGMQRDYALDASDRILHKTPTGFDVSVWELFWPLTTGAAIVLARPGGHREPDYLADLIRTAGVTTVHFVPSMLRAFIEEPSAAGCTGLRRVFCGGESLSGDLAQQVSSTLPAMLHHLYGPTEATIDVTQEPDVRDAGDLVPIGKPVAGTQVYVLDAALRPVGVGVTGELYLAGSQLARGYFGAAGLTADRFVACPFGAPGARMYRTGDLVRWGSDGRLEFRGRTDQQIKVHGVRIEPAEIEAAMLALPGISRALVLAHTTGEGARHLVAYVVGPAHGVRERLAEDLPAHLVPTTVISVPQMPLTANGKVDRKALPEPSFADRPTGGRAVQGAVEEQLAGLFAETLGLERVGADEGFFALGGDSIMAIQLAGRARRAGLTIGPRDIFDHQTVASLASIVGQDVAVVEPLDDGVGPVALTPIVHRLRERPGAVEGFYQSVTLDVPSGLDRSAVTAAVQALLDRHDALRLKLTRSAGGLLWALEVTAAGSVRAEDCVFEENSDTAGLEQALARLDPSAGRMLQVALLPDRMLVVAHHLSVDGVSWRILLPDLREAYQAALQGQRAQLAPVATSLRTWSHQLGEHAQDPALLEELTWWAEELGAPGARIGSRALDPSIDVVSTARSVTVDLPHVSDPDDTLLGTLAVALHHWRGGAALIDREIHGRSVDGPGDLSRTVGWFTAVHPLRLPATGDAVEAVRQVREHRAQVPGDGTGFGLLRYVNPQTTALLAALPKAEIAMNYLGKVTAGGGLDGWTVQGTGAGTSPQAALPYVVNITALAVDERLTATLTFAGQILTEDEVGELAGLWVAALRGVAEEQKAPGLDGESVARIEARYPGFAEALPLSRLQEGLLFHALHETSDPYTPQLLVDLDGPVDGARLRSAFDQVLERHATLRVAVPHDLVDRPVQVVLPGLGVGWQELDLRATPGQAEELARAEDFVLQDRARGFDLTQPPLIRVTLLRLADQRYRMVITHHHILLDGWSMALLARELLTVWSGATPAAPVPYRHHLAWLEKQDREAAVAAWAERLHGVDGPTLLAGPGASAAAGEPSMHEQAVPAGLGRRLIAWARGNGLTVNTVLQGAWALVLARLTGRGDVTFGAAVSGRPADLTGAEDMIGLFINTVPVRVPVPEHVVPVDLLKDLQQAQSALLPHHHLGLSDVHRAAGQSELFDTLLVFQNYPVAADLPSPQPGVAVTGVTFREATHYPLALIASDRGGDLTLRFAHDPAALTSARVQEIADLLVRVLAAVVENRPVEALTPAEADLVLLASTGEDSGRTPAGITETFAQQVLQRGDEVALRGDFGTLTYADLDARGNELAHRLAALGVRPGDRVGVRVPRSVEYVVALLAVLKAGAAYVPVDERLPDSRARLMLEGTAALVTDTPENSLHATIVTVGAFSGAAEPPAPHAHPDDLAYVMFTSGSTGVPKGVEVTQSGVVAICTQRRWGIADDDVERVLLQSGPGGDPATFEVWAPLLTGGEIVIAPPGEPGAALVRHAVGKHGATTALFTAGLFRVLAEEDPDCLNGLRMVLTGGDIVSAAAVRRALTHVPHLAVADAYGPTEATVFVTYYEMTTPDDVPDVVPIGSPVPDARVHVLGRDLRPVPPGVRGELYLAGPQLARGYTTATVTAERFVPDPYGPPGSRMYRTGDHARWTGEGLLEFLGRTDDQVKIRGHRIELAEVEALLTAREEVADAVVVAREQRLVGYVVPSEATAFDPEQLRTQLLASIPTHLVPSVLMALPVLPLTPLGKVDRRALPAPAAVTTSAGRAPRTPREEQLCELFAHVLGVEQVAPEDGFFALGGDSIMSIQLVSRARRAGLTFTTRDVFRYPTVAELAVVCEELTGDEAASPEDGVGFAPFTPVMKDLTARGVLTDRFHQSVLLAVPAGLGEEPLRAAVQAVVERHDALRLRLDRAGQRLEIRAAGSTWATEDQKREPAGGGQNSEPAGGGKSSELAGGGKSSEPAGGGKSSEPAGGGQSGELAGEGQSGEPAREGQNGEPVGKGQSGEPAGPEQPTQARPVQPGQLLLRRVPVSPSTLDQALAAEGEAAAAALDPENGDVLRVIWFDAGTEPGRLLLLVHHLAVDGVSWRILVPDLYEAWQAATEGRAIELAPVATSLRGWNRHLAELADSPQVAGEVEYWQALGTGPAQAPRGPAVRHRLDIPAGDLLDRIPARFHTGVDDLLLGALAVALNREALVELETHGRAELPGTDLTSTMGWFTATHPVRLPLTTGHGPAAAVKLVKESRSAVPGDGLGYGLLRHLKGVELPIPEISFNYLGRATAAGSAGAWHMVPNPHAPGMGADVPLTHVLALGVIVTGETLTANWTADQSHYTESELREIADRWAEALHQLQRTDEGGHTPSDFPLVTTTQEDVERLEAAYPQIEDVWPLAPLQDGLLFHALYDEQSADVYTSQVELRLDGPLNPAALKQAWEMLLRRHPSLRAGFAHQETDQPVQVVLGHPVLPWRETTLPEATQEQIDQLAATEQAEKFDLSRPPLLRLLLIAAGPQRHHLIFTHHHILLDGWSIGLLARELFELYAGRALPAPAPYRDHLARLAERDRQAAREAWQEELSTLDEPTLLAPGAPPAKEAGTVVTAVPADITDQLKDLARSTGLTMNTLMQGALAVVLARMTGRDDVTFGATVSGRPEDVPGSESMIGLFINTVPVRVQLDEPADALDILTRLQHRQSELSAHHHLGPGEITRLSGHPELFDTLLVFENYPIEALPSTAEGPTLGHAVIRDATHYPLAVAVIPTAGSYEFRLRHNPRALTEARVTSLGERLVHTLKELAADPRRPFTAIDALPAPEKHRILTEWNSGTSPRTDASVTDLFARQVTQQPQAVAVRWDGGRLTYQELDRRANALAQRLNRAGVKRGDFVALALDRSAHVVVAELAVLKAGAAYVPVEDRLPDARVQVQLAQAQVRVALVDERHAPGASARLGTEHTLLMDDATADEAPLVPSVPDDAAYVMFTSGSTGVPKGVLISHRGVVSLATDQRYPRGNDERVLLHAPYGFDPSTYEVWRPLLLGGQIVIAPPGDLDVATISRLVSDHGLTEILLTAGLFRVVAEEDPACLNGVREVLTGGDVVPAAAVRRVLTHCPGTRVSDIYGPTEITLFATQYPMDEASAVPANVPIGRGRDGMRAYVLDHRLRPTPPGVSGDLYIAGDALARGYLQAPGITAERFSADPYALTPGERMYRTGDLARWSDEGAIEFLGRADHQVKIRGFRIELDEVGSAIAACDGIVDAAVEAKQTATGAKHLVGYVVTEPGHVLDEAAVLNQLAAELPDYMVPGRLVELAVMPVTSNGKLDRRALPDPEPASATGAGGEARTAGEKLLCDLYADVLGVERVGPDDGFFALGGDSIMSIQLVSRARRAGLRFAPKDVFHHQTPAALATVVQEEPNGAPHDDGTGELYPTPVMADLRRRGRLTNDLHQSLLLEVGPDLGEQALIGAVQTVLDHHDALRLSWAGELPVISAPGSVRAEDCVRRVAGDFRQDDAEAAVAQLDPAEGRLLQVVWFDAGQLLIVVHHLAIDGVSWRILVPDLYEAWQGNRSLLATTSLRRWTALLHERAQAADELAFWSDLLGERAAEQRTIDASGSGSVTVSLDARSTEHLLTSVAAGPDELLLGALAVAFRGWDEVGALVDRESHGRHTDDFDDVDLTRTVGWFTSIHPVRLPVGETDPVQAVRLVKDHLRTIPGHGLGYGLLRQAHPQAAGLPSARASFNYLGRVRAEQNIGSWKRLPSPVVPSQHQEPGYPLSINAVTAEDGRLTATWTWDRRFLTHDEVQQAATRWLTTLEALATQPQGGRTPSDFPLVELTPADVEALEQRYPDLEDVLPLGPLQEGLLFHARDDRSTTDVYTSGLSLELTGPLDEHVLREAWNTLLQRHPSLRSGFIDTEAGTPVQVVLRKPELAWRTADLRGEANAEQQLEALTGQERAARFDPAEPPLLRLLLARLADDRHRLVVTPHHILVDGWSMPVLVRELLALHTGRTLPAAVPYREHLTWLARQDRRAAQQAWAANLDGVDGPTLLASSTGTAQEQEYLAADVPAQTSERLRQVARTAGVTVNTVLQLAWALVLGRRTGRSDVVFGATVSGRPAEVPGVESIVGLFINTIPVRVTLDPTASLNQVLASLQRAQVALSEYHHLGLTELLRAAGHPELFDTLLVFENYPLDPATASAGGDLQISGVQGREGTHYPVSLIVLPRQQISLRLGYRPDVVGAALASSLTCELLSVLNRLATDPDQPVACVDPLAADERDRALAAAIGAHAAVPEMSLAHQVAQQAARTPEALAIVDGNQRLTYAEFERRVGDLAAQLRELGAGPEQRVAVQLRRGAGLLIAVHAVLRAGAVYVPIDPDQPAERIAGLLAEADPVHVITSLPESTGRELKPEPVHQQQAAYLIFTSGSTGRPKGVVVPHHAISSRIAGMQQEFGLDTGDRVLHKTPISFDVSVWELLWPLTTGAAIVIARPDGHLQPDYLAALIQAEQVSTVHFVPSMLAVFLNEPAAGQITSLRRVICSGEALGPEVAARLDRTLNVPLYNLYGPTEAAIDVSHWRHVPGETVVPIGRPVPNTATYLLDGALRPVPDGVPGEVYLAGDQLSRGYPAQPALTSARFVADPFGAPGARMYRTGDQARRRPDGALEYLGRADDQVKVRGVRIELGEIEGVLLRHPAVEQASVLVINSTLTAYLVLNRPAADLRQYCRTLLPEVMVPAALVELDEMPLTRNGKLDRAALPTPETETTHGRAAATPQEQAWCDLFAEVLELGPVGADQSFFDLGGHSLLALRLIARARTVLGAEIGIRALFEHSTPAALAQLTSLDAVGDPLVPLLPLRVEGERPPLFCVHPHTGVGWPYAGLLPVLPDRPLYALQARGLREIDRIPASISEMARDYVTQLREVQPSGPYHLLGWSFGGLVAHEMAVQLRESGSQVELLAIVDAFPPGSVDERALYGDAEMPEQLRAWISGQNVPWRAVLGHHTELMKAFRPSVFDGSALLFTADRGRGDEGPGIEHWRPYVSGPLVRHRLDTTHHNVTEPAALARIGAEISRNTMEETQ
ncbi:hypothetical protein GCM10027456_32340 [Kineosporia babensis]